MTTITLTFPSLDHVDNLIAQLNNVANRKRRASGHCQHDNEKIRLCIDRPIGVTMEYIGDNVTDVSDPGSSDFSDDVRYGDVGSKLVSLLASTVQVINEMDDDALRDAALHVIMSLMAW